MTTDYMYDIIMNNLGKNLPFEEKTGYSATVVNVFVEDITKIDNEAFREKTYELARYIYDYMNYVTFLQVYVRDDSYFEDIDLLRESIWPQFLKSQEITPIIKKISEGKKPSEKEKLSLIRVMDKNLNYQNCHIKDFWLIFNDEESSTFDLEDVRYASEIKNGVTLYQYEEKEEIVWH